MRVFISGPICVSPVSNLHFNTVFNTIAHILYNYILYFHIKLNTAAFVIVTFFIYWHFSSEKAQDLRISSVILKG